MDKGTVVEVLFAASAIVAGIATLAKAKAKVFRSKVEPIALAVCLAAAAFFVEASNLFSGK
jgi:hypothetical protein